MARSMLTFKKLSPIYWAKAIHTVVYLRNRSPTASLDGITPYEAWFGFTPKVKHFRVFGSMCYALVPKEKRTKLDSRSFKCTMIGYSNEKKGYRLLSNGKFIVSRDVIFYETKSKSAEEIEHLLQKLETKGDKRKGNIQSQPNSQNCSSESPSSSSSSDNDSPPIESAVDQHTSVYINPLYNDGDFSESQTSEHQLPKWVVQLLKDARPDEKNKTGTRGSTRNEGNFALITNDFTEPSTYKEAVKYKEWQQAMVEEYKAVQESNTWKLVDCPQSVKPIGCKWVYRIKYNQNGEIDKYKARLVAKGFAQQEGIDYEETFAPTAKWNTIHLTLALAAQKGWKVHQMDVKSAFLNRDLQEDVYMTQPPSFEIEGQEHKVCTLIKALYGFKQAPRA
eukprot:PITA_03684